MTTTRTRSLPSLALLLFLVCSPPGVSGQAFDDLGDRVDEIFAPWNAEVTPGCAVAAARDGETTLRRAYGMANLEHDVPNTPESIFEAGSVSKQLTAAAVVLLALDGALSLDDDIRAYVPEVPDYGVAITIRHLLHHTSGLRDWGRLASISGWGRTARTHSHDHVLDILSRQEALNHPPGERYSYTTSGYNLLAIIGDRASPTSFAEFSRERIFLPLGMTRTEWRDDFRRLVPGRATAYSRRGDRYEINQPIENIYGNSALLTTVEDLLAWTHNLETGAVGGPRFRQIMHETGTLNDGSETPYAAGLRIGGHGGLLLVDHGGSTAGYRAYLGRFPERNLAVAVLCNAADAAAGRAGQRIADLLLEGALEPEEEGAPDPAVTLARSHLEDRAGLYREVDTGEPLRLVVEGEALRIPGGPRLVPLSEDLFRSSIDDRRFTFEASEAGTRPRIRETRGLSVDPYGLQGFGREGTYEPVEETQPVLRDLAPYPGEYHSNEAEITLVVAIEGNALVVRRRPFSSFPLEPLYPDAFRLAPGFIIDESGNAAPPPLVRFHRDGAGRVKELSLHQRGTHDVRFLREIR